MPTFKMFATLNIHTKLNMDTIIIYMWPWDTFRTQPFGNVSEGVKEIRQACAFNILTASISLISFRM